MSVDDWLKNETWAKMIRFKGAKYVFKTKERLPKMVIDLFVESNGIKIRTGDRSHPDSLEVEAWYPSWGSLSTISYTSTSTSNKVDQTRCRRQNQT